MMRQILTLTLTLVAAPAWADYPETIREYIQPGYAAFAAATADLSAKAAADCTAQSLRPAYQAAFDAWMAVAHLHLGPVADHGRSLAIAYWPDPKGLGIKLQMDLLTGDPAALAPEAMARQSIAARGLFGLERLLYPATDLPADACPLIRATAADLARMAAEVNSEWDSYAQSMLTAGEAGNAAFLSGKEVRQALFTQLETGLEFLSDQRLGRPLGQPTQPHPDRAEARAADRPLRNVVLQLQAMRRMVQTLTPDVPRTIAAFDHAIGLAEKLGDPTFAGIDPPSGRLKLEILQQSVQRLREVMLEELAPELDVGIGFNAGDGD
ncbi:MAG: imelysin family protein [Paracoccaceae bacterium]